MTPADFGGAVQWVIAHGYLLMFVAMLLEGPVVTAAAAFAAALGAFNIWLVLILSILGNIIPDAVFYALGYYGRAGIIDRHPRLFRIPKDKLEKLERLYETHAGKTLAAVKLLPLLATPGLVVAGIARVPLKKYTFWNIVITIPSSLFYLIIGYYFAAAYQSIEATVKHGEYAAAAVIGLFVIVYIIYRKVSAWIGKKIEEI